MKITYDFDFFFLKLIKQVTDENISTGQAQAANKNNKDEKKLTSFIRKNLIHEKNKGGWKYASILLGTTSVMSKFSLFFVFYFIMVHQSSLTILF